jgi:hypothetical protein
MGVLPARSNVSLVCSRHMLLLCCVYALTESSVKVVCCWCLFRDHCLLLVLPTASCFAKLAGMQRRSVPRAWHAAPHEVAVKKGAANAQVRSRCGMQHAPSSLLSFAAAHCCLMSSGAAVCNLLIAGGVTATHHQWLALRICLRCLATAAATAS